LSALVAAKQIIALDTAQARERLSVIEAVGDQFRFDAYTAALHLPRALQLHRQRRKLEGGSDTSAAAIHVGPRHTLSGGLRILDGSNGVAGGAKAAHPTHGLFLKIPDNGAGMLIESKSQTS